MTLGTHSHGSLFFTSQTNYYEGVYLLLGFHHPLTLPLAAAGVLNCKLFHYSPPVSASSPSVTIDAIASPARSFIMRTP